MFPIIKLDETITPTHVFVAMTRSRRSSRCLIEPSDNFDFSVFGKGTPLNPKNELLLAHLRGNEDFEEQLVEYHSRAKAKKPKADPKSISSSVGRRARRQGRAATASASERGARMATASGRVAIECSSRQRGAKAGEPATSKTSARRGVRAGELEGEPATSKTSARRGVRAGELEGEPATSRTSARQGVRAGEPETSRTSARRGMPAT
jgi:hypothetical protein